MENRNSRKAQVETYADLSYHPVLTEVGGNSWAESSGDAIEISGRIRKHNQRRECSHQFLLKWIYNLNLFFNKFINNPFKIN